MLCVEYGAEVDVVDNMKRTPLHYAVMSANMDLVDLLISEGVDINAKDENGTTPLTYSYNCPDIVQFLLSRGAISTPRSDGMDLMMLAVSRNYLWIVKMLSEKEEEDVEKRHPITNCSLLEMAFNSNHLDMARLLVHFGADINGKTSSGDTYLWKAVTQDSEDKFKLILKLGATIHSEDEKCNILWWAAAHGPVEIIKALVKAGETGVNKAMYFGISPLAAAMIKGSHDVVKYLSRMVRPGGIVKPHQLTYLRYLELDNRFEYPLFHTAALVGGDDLLTYLTKSGKVNVNEREKGHTPIQLSAQHNASPSTLRLLVQLGAEINNPEDALLHIAAQYNPSMIKELLKLGADINMMATTDEFEYDVRPLNIALAHNKLEVVRELIAAGANLTDYCGQGMPPIFYCRSNQSLQLMVDAGADINQIDSKGRTPLSQFSEDLSMVQKVISLGAKTNKEEKRNCILQ